MPPKSNGSKGGAASRPAVAASMNLRHWRAVLRNHPRPARLVLARLLERTGLSPLFTVTLDSYKLRFYPTNLSANLWIDPDSRTDGLALFKDYCKPGDVAIDVGANIGQVSIILSQRAGRDGRVFAFEPNPRVVRYLEGNLALNGCANTTVRNAALGASAGPVRMSDGARDDMNRVDTTGTIEVACSTLDAEIPAGAPIAFLKIDVEGSELRVLQGGQATLARTECVNCEMGEDHHRRYGYGMTDLISFPESRGFRTFVAGRSRTLRAVGADFNEPGGHELVAIRRPADFLTRTGWTIE